MTSQILISRCDSDKQIANKWESGVDEQFGAVKSDCFHNVLASPAQNSIKYLNYTLRRAKSAKPVFGRTERMSTHSHI